MTCDVSVQEYRRGSLAENALGTIQAAQTGFLDNLAALPWRPELFQSQGTWERRPTDLMSSIQTWSEKVTFSMPIADYNNKDDAWLWFRLFMEDEKNTGSCSVLSMQSVPAWAGT